MIDTISKALGFVRQYNPLSVAPGALSLAENVMIRRENIIEPRRGFTNNLSTSYNTIDNVGFFNGEAVGHKEDSGILYYYPSGVETAIGSVGDFIPPTGFKSRLIEAYQNLYMTAGDGVKVIPSLTGTPRVAGAPRGLDYSYALTSGASGFLANTYQCAYRHLIKRIDANDNVIFGYPSQRLWTINASGAAENVTLTITLGTEVLAGDVIQVYRTAQASGTATDTSGDECGLVYEFTITASEITAGEISFTDSITDTLIGANLYTNPSEEGILQANAQPPVSKDIALYKSNFMFYANTSGKQRLNFSLVGTSGLSGNTLTIGGQTYNFGATEIVSGAGSPQIIVGTTGVAAADIDSTARSLVKVINQWASNTTVYAYYLSGPDDLPGQILLETRSLSANSQFTITASNTTIGAMTFPEAQTTTSDAMTSSKDIRENALFYSKNQQPEAVPLLNYLPVGPSNSAILRIAPLRDSMIIISEAGIFRLTGEDPASFTIVTLDDTVRIKAIESVKVLANQVYALSNQGVIRISENGVEVVSREIEIEMTKLLSTTDFEDDTFAGVYESERLYLLSTKETNLSTEADVTYVYNIFTKTWTVWTFGFQAARVNETNEKLYYVEPSGGSNLLVERRDFEDSDYADAEYKMNSTNSLSGFTVNVVTPSATDIPKVGDLLQDSSATPQAAHITDVVDNGSNTYALTLDDELDALSGNVYIYPRIDVQWEWLPWTAKQPAMLKQVRSVALLADDTSGQNTVTDFDLSFRTNFESSKSYVNMAIGGSGWGSFWGGAWGTGANDNFAYPTYCPMEYQYANRFFFGGRHRKAREKLSIAGLGVEFEMVSEEVGK